MMALFNQYQPSAWGFGTGQRPNLYPNKKYQYVNFTNQEEVKTLILYVIQKDYHKLRKNYHLRNSEGNYLPHGKSVEPMNYEIFNVPKFKYASSTTFADDERKFITHNINQIHETFEDYR